MFRQAWHAACVHPDRYHCLKLNNATHIFPIALWGTPMTVQYAMIAVSDGLRVSGTGYRSKSLPRSYPTPPAGRGGVLGGDDDRQGGRTESAAAPSEERRRACRRPYRLPLTVSVFNQGAVFEAQMVDCGQDGICMETGHRLLPGTSLHVRIDTRQAAGVGKAVSQGLRTTALGEAKWCRALSQNPSSRYHVGIRYYPYY
jgi:PilZ domain